MPPVSRRKSRPSATASGLTRQDFANILTSIQSASQDFADFVAAGDPTFNLTYNRTPLPSTRTPSDQDFE